MKDRAAEPSADLLRALALAGAKFVVIGGVALQIQGSGYTTYDLDLAYDRSKKNSTIIVETLRSFAPRLRGWSSDLPFIFDARTQRARQ